MLVNLNFNYKTQFNNTKLEVKHFEFFFLYISIVVVNQIVLWYKIKWVFEKNAC